MNEAMPPPRPPETNGGFNELLREERRDILELAGRFHTIAHRHDGMAVGDTNQIYVVADDHDIPLASEKIRIVPHNTRTAPIAEAYLYLPFDPDLQEEREHTITPSMIFLMMRYRGGVVKRAIVSELTVWIFGDNEPMQIDTDKLPSRAEELDVPALFSTGTEVVGEEEYKLLQEMKVLLSLRGRYRLGDQGKPEVSE